jgi:hypothetical protein
MSDPSRDLIQELASGLEPVRPIPRVGLLLAGVLGVAAVVALGVFAIVGSKPGLWTALAGDDTYACVCVGLVLAMLGGCTAALASAVPGRERLQRVAAVVAIAGLAGAVVPAVVATPWGEPGLANLLSFPRGCIARGALLAVLPAAAVLALAARGWSARPGLTVAFGLLGSGAVGALLVHLTCPAADPFHLLSTHTSTPFLLVLLLTAPFAPAMRRWAR